MFQKPIQLDHTKDSLAAAMGVDDKDLAIGNVSHEQEAISQVFQMVTSPSREAAGALHILTQIDPIIASAERPTVIVENLINHHIKAGSTVSLMRAVAECAAPIEAGSLEDMMSGICGGEGGLAGMIDEMMRG